MALGDGDLVHLVAVFGFVVGDEVACAVGHGFAQDRDAAQIAAAVGATHDIARRAVAAGHVEIDRHVDRGLDLLRNDPAVEHDPPAAQRDPVAGQRDHALDIVFLAVGGDDDHHVAIFGRAAEHAPVAARQDVEARRDPAVAVGPLADDEAVADQQARHHRSGRNVERLGDEAVERQHGEQHQREAAQFPQPVDRGLVVFGSGGLAGGLFGHAGNASITTRACAHG